MVELTNAFSFALKPKPPFNFELSVRKPAGWDLFTPAETYENGKLWTGLYIGELVMGLKLRSEGTISSPKIHATAYSKKALSTNQKVVVKQTVATKLGVDEDLTEFYEMSKNDKILGQAITDLYGMHDTQNSSLFGAAILTICLQMAPLKRSNQMMNCILKNYGEIAVFDNKLVQIWPVPQVIARLEMKKFSKECNLGFRAKYLVQLAEVLASGIFPSMEELTQLPPEVAREKLLELPEIGDYSADIINPHGGFPIDAWSVEVFGKLFFGKISKSPRDMIDKVKKEGIKRWGKWSCLAFFYVANDLENLSRHLGTKLRLA